MISIDTCVISISFVLECLTLLFVQYVNMIRLDFDDRHGSLSKSPPTPQLNKAITHDVSRLMTVYYPQRSDMYQIIGALPSKKSIGINVVRYARGWYLFSPTHRRQVNFDGSVLPYDTY